MINELINSIKQAYRDIETGSRAYEKSVQRTAETTPQALVEVEQPLQPGAITEQAPEMAPPAQAQRMPLLDILASK